MNPVRRKKMACHVTKLSYLLPDYLTNYHIYRFLGHYNEGLVKQHDPPDVSIGGQPTAILPENFSRLP